MQRTKIQYLTHSWTPIAMRCTQVSEGCRTCWHLAMAKRLEKNPNIPECERLAYRGLAMDVDTKQIVGEPILREKELEAPLHLRKPARIAIQLMGDAFHDSISFEWLDAILATVVYCEQHTFLMLTKRPARMREYFTDPKTPFRIQREIDTLTIQLECKNLKEEWRDIGGFEGLYQVSNHGRVRSFSTRWTAKSFLDGIPRNGYVIVTLCKKGEKIQKYIHALVLETFVGPAQEGEECCHRNGDRSFNLLPNLRWGTKKDNHSDSARHGMAGTWMKSRADFTPEQVAEIRRRRAAGEKLPALAKEFGSTMKQLWKIVHNKTYKLPQIEWPLRNLWLGVSCEDQPTADERIPILLQIPAAHRWVSVEPMLGPMYLKLMGIGGFSNLKSCYGDSLNWVVCGCETGPKARPCHPDWIRSIKDQCANAGIPFFYKNNEGMIDGKEYWEIPK